MAACARCHGDVVGDDHVSIKDRNKHIDGIVDAATRQLAFENACAVVLAREVMSQDRLPPELGAIVTSEPQYWHAHGGSAIVAPGGEYITRPVFDEEPLVRGEVELGLIPVPDTHHTPPTSALM